MGRASFLLGKVATWPIPDPPTDSPWAVSKQAGRQATTDRSVRCLQHMRRRATHAVLINMHVYNGGGGGGLVLVLGPRAFGSGTTQRNAHLVPRRFFKTPPQPPYSFNSNTLPNINETPFHFISAFSRSLSSHFLTVYTKLT